MEYNSQMDAYMHGTPNYNLGIPRDRINTVERGREG